MPPSTVTPPAPPSPTADRLRGQRRVRLLLEQIDALPALSPVVARLLTVTADDEADIRQIVSLIESDVAMTSRVLTMCRRADLGVRDQVVSVERAVVLLGIDALRHALLCAEIFEKLTEAGDRVALAVELAEEAPALDMKGLWRHSLAAACAAQQLAQRVDPPVKPAEAFLAGLLHDLGKWALALVLPRTFAKLARAAQQRQCDLAPLERSVVGVDHFTAGKRLAERWGLPAFVRDAIWLHGQPAAARPSGTHEAVVAVVGAADALARRACIGWSGDESPPPSPRALAQDLHTEAETLERIQCALHAEVARRAWAIGLEETAERDLLQESLERATAKLEQTHRLAARARLQAADSVDRSRRVLDAFTQLLDAAQTADPSELLRCVVASIAHCSRSAQLVAALRQGPDQQVELRLCDAAGAVLDVDVAQPPGPGAAAPPSWLRTRIRQLGWLDSEEQALRNGASTAQQLHEAARVGGEEAFVAVLTTRPAPAEDGLATLWHVLLKAWLDAQRSAALAEALAQANRVLAEAQPKLAEAAALEMLFETTAGLAHEMNNPLTVIQGWAQRLVEDGADRRGAEAVQRAAARLSQLVADLHLFASPVEPRPKEVDLSQLLTAAAQQARERAVAGREAVIRLIAPEPSPHVYLDAEHVQQALAELIVNALDAEPRTQVQVRAHLDLATGRLMFSVEDDGVGMEQRVRARCFDPFFSFRAAGRGLGLGLPRARRLVEASGGVIELESQPGQGATARIVFPRFLASRSRTERERA